MDRLVSLLRANPGLLAMAGIVVIATFVLSLIAVMMARAGQSLRPIAFIAIFMAIIVGPQAVWHTLVAAGKVAEAPTWVGKSARAEAPVTTTPPPIADAKLAELSATLAARPGDVSLEVDGGAFRDPERVYGAGIDPSLIRRDAQRIFGEALAKAQHAELASIGETGETIVAARFASPAEARAGRDAYLRFLGMPAAAEGHSFWLTRRPTGDVAGVAVAGAGFFAWTSATEESLLARARKSEAVRIERVSAAEAPVGAASPEAVAGGAPVSGRSTSAPRRVPTWAFFAFMGVNLVVAAAWFFKGVPWAGSIAPREQLEAVSADALRARLLAIGEGDVPFDVRAGEGGEEVEVTWRWADARWIDLARARRVTRTHRLVLRLDESARVVRVLEYMSAFDASAGRGGATLSWKVARGVTFFQKEYEKGVGVALDERGRPTGALTYEWRFDLDELKAPFVRAVTSGGWEWRPALF